MAYVVVGASAAGINGARTLREYNKDAEIILISKDEHVYSRCILHHYLDGRRTVEDLDFTPREFFDKYNIKWIKGKEVTKIKPEEHSVCKDRIDRLDASIFCIIEMNTLFTDIDKQLILLL